MNRIIRQYEKLLSLPGTNAEKDYDVIFESAFKISDEMRSNSQYNNALILLNWVVVSCRKVTDSKMKLKVMKKAGRAVWEVGNAMKRKRHDFSADVLKEAIPILKKLLKMMEETGTTCVREIAEAQAWCYYYTAACHQYSKKYSKVCLFSNNAISLMKDTFGPDYVKFRVVALSHAMTGEAWASMKSYEYAIEEYERASEIFETVEDIKNEIYRKSCINYEKSKIRELRQATLFQTFSFRSSKRKKVKEKEVEEEKRESIALNYNAQPAVENDCRVNLI